MIVGAYPSLSLSFTIKFILNWSDYMILIYAIVWILTTMLILGIIYMISGGRLFKRVYHDIMGWHLPDNTKKTEGINTCSKCKICKKDIIRDSQGNWFTY